MIQRSATARRLVDYQTYRELVKDGEKADLIDGVIYMASRETRPHNTLNIAKAKDAPKGEIVEEGAG